MPARVFGDIPGVSSGSVFTDRRELHDSSVHRPLQAGISGSASEGADSIVVSGGYEDDVDSGDTIVYTGHGGNDPSSGKQVADQELSAGNAALVVSQQRGYPVRVVRGAGGDPNYSPATGYRYDGLYDVVSHWDEMGASGFRVIRFELRRRDGQAPSPWVRENEIRKRAPRRTEDEPSSQRNAGTSGLQNHIGDVGTALDLVVETARTVAGDVQAQAQDAVGHSKYGDARGLLDLAERLAAFTDRVAQISSEWAALSPVLAGDAASRPRQTGRGAQRTKRGPRKRADYGKTASEDKTSQREYLLPILEVLVDLGGSAPASDVLAGVEERVRSQFKPADLEPIASNSRETRWRNTAQWARQQLVNQGLLEPSKKRGVWEISQAGREYLQRPATGAD